MATQSALACFYGEYGLDREDGEQTTAFELINERYSEEQNRKPEFFRQAMQDMADDLSSKSGDPDFMENYAYVLQRMGRSKEAFEIWNGLLAKDPKRYSTLCNLATGLQGLSRFDEAASRLQEAIKLRPGNRSGAEEYHLQYIDFMKRQRSESGYGTRHLFIDELTAVWEKRKRPPETFDKVAGFPAIKTDGVAELLRQFPRFGDGWLVLGMLLERDGEHYLALRAYERAEKFGTGQRDALKVYLRSYREFAKSTDPPRSAARKITYLLGLVAGLAVLYFVLKFARLVILDITSPDRKKPPLSTKPKPPAE